VIHGDVSCHVDQQLDLGVHRGGIEVDSGVGQSGDDKACSLVAVAGCLGVGGIQKSEGGDNGPDLVHNVAVLGGKVMSADQNCQQKEAEVVLGAEHVLNLSGRKKCQKGGKLAQDERVEEAAQEQGLNKVLGVLVDHVDGVSDLGEGSFVGCVDGADGKGNPDTGSQAQVGLGGGGKNPHGVQVDEPNGAGQDVELMSGGNGSGNWGLLSGGFRRRLRSGGNRSGGLCASRLLLGSLGTLWSSLWGGGGDACGRSRASGGGRSRALAPLWRSGLAAARRHFEGEEKGW